MMSVELSAHVPQCLLCSNLCYIWWSQKKRAYICICVSKMLVGLWTCVSTPEYAETEKDTDLDDRKRDRDRDRDRHRDKERDRDRDRKRDEVRDTRTCTHKRCAVSHTQERKGHSHMHAQRKPRNVWQYQRKRQQQRQKQRQGPIYYFYREF